MAERCDKGCGGTEDVTKNSAFIDKAGEKWYNLIVWIIKEWIEERTSSVARRIETGMNCAGKGRLPKRSDFSGETVSGLFAEDAADCHRSGALSGYQHHTKSGMSWAHPNACRPWHFSWDFTAAVKTEQYACCLLLKKKSVGKPFAKKKPSFLFSSLENCNRSL